MNFFWYDFKLSSFSKMMHKIYKESVHIYKFIFIPKWLRIFLTYWGILIVFHNKLQKNHSKNHWYEKIILGEKDM
jgi:hypothetical protein